MADQAEYQRVNFFAGMFTTAEDWNAAHDYHRQRLAQHNRVAYGVGIVRAVGNELNVTVSALTDEQKKDGVFGVTVWPGAAIDKNGNVLEVLTCKTVTFKMPASEAGGDADPPVVRVVIQHKAQPDDFIVNPQQTAYSGHTRVTETIELLADPVVSDTAVELARIKLTQDAVAIYDPKNKDCPGENEIDRTEVTWSSSTKSLDQDIDCLQARMATEEEKSDRFAATDAAHNERLDGLDQQVDLLDGRLDEEEETSKKLIAGAALLTAGVAALEAQAILHGKRLQDEEELSEQFAQQIAQELEQSKRFREELDALAAKAAALSAHLDAVAGYGRLHNRGSHTVGILQEGERLRVQAAGGLNVQIGTGAALDETGGTIFLDQPRTLTIDPAGLKLPQLVFVALGFDGDEPGNAYPQIKATLPADEPWIELARIDLQPGVEAVTDPLDPDQPAGNQIDQRYRPISSAVVMPGQALAPDLTQQIVLVMGEIRRAFGALDGKFPVPSASDTRYMCVTVESMARIGNVRAQQVQGLMTTLVGIEQDVTRDLEKAYPRIMAKAKEYEKLVDAVNNVEDSLASSDLNAILIAQHGVARAAQNLADKPLERPAADAGDDQSLHTYDDQASTTLDASESEARGDRDIDEYRWTRGEDETDDRKPGEKA